jgi:hypothetical protein
MMALSQITEIDRHISLPVSTNMPDTVSLEKTTSTDSLHSSHACRGYKSIPYLGRFPEAYWLHGVGIAVEQQHQQDSWAG